MRVAIISANLGAYDPPHEWAPQVVPGATVSVHRFDDSNFPPRSKAMTPALQVGLLKWFGPDFVPVADAVIWIDASCAPTPQSASWFLDRLGSADVAVFAHPERMTIREEYEFIVGRMARRGESYLNGRYKGEWIAEQFAMIEQAGKADLPLYASTAFAYRPTPKVLSAFADVFLLKARYLLHDQLAFPYALDKHMCSVNIIRENYLKCDALMFMRNKGRAR